jgi:hypothetical protein
MYAATEHALYPKLSTPYINILPRFPSSFCSYTSFINPALPRITEKIRGNNRQTTGGLHETEG